MWVWVAGQQYLTTIGAGGIAKVAEVCQNQLPSAPPALPGPTLPDYQAVIDYVIRSELPDITFTEPPTFDPSLADYGDSFPANELGQGGYTHIGEAALQSTSETVNTLVHEELHHRVWEATNYWDLPVEQARQISADMEVYIDEAARHADLDQQVGIEITDTYLNQLAEEIRRLLLGSP
jgi:hypothetical protein